MKKGITSLGIVAIFVALIQLSACKVQKTATGNSEKKASVSHNNNLDVPNLFFDANKEKILGNYEAAANLFNQCIKADKTNHAAMYELALIYEQQGKNNDALAHIKNAISLDGKNVWYQVAYAEILKKNKLHGEAVNVYNQLVKAYPDRIDYYYHLATTQVHAGKIADAIKTYDKLEELIGISPEISTQKERLYVKMNKIDKAIAELQKLIDAFPHESQYYGMLAELYQANDMNSKAMEVYNKILEIDPDNPYIHLSLAEYYRSAGNKEKSFLELKQAFSNKGMEIDTKIQILNSYFIILQSNDELKDQAITLSEILIETHPNDAAAYAKYGDFLYQDQKYSEARDQYRKAIQLNKENFGIWQYLLYSESELNDYTAMLSESEEALTLFPNQPLIYLFNGIANIQKKKYQESIEVLQSGLNMIVENNAMKAQFYANLGDVYYKLNKMAESDESYEQALKLDPKNTYVLNNYSYYLSLRGENLEKAEKMSKLSNELKPDDSSFLDTYAWILYKLKRFDDARIWLEKAIEHGGGKSAVILEHYGDVLYQLSNAAKAYEYWEKALKAGEGSEWLTKKIADKKLYE